MDADKKVVTMNSSLELSTILQQIIDQNLKNEDQYIQQYLQSQNIEEFEILKYLGNYFKITPSNYLIILQNSESFIELNKACIFYKEIIENVEIEQQNFVNILILDHLLINITSSNVAFYSVYANLFLVDIDMPSFYQIVFNHCLGLPHSIYEISLFVKECNDINDNRAILRKCYLDLQFDFQFLKKWEFGTFGYFLYRHELLERSDLINIYEYSTIHTLNDAIFMNNEYYNHLRNFKTYDNLLNCFFNDDIDLFSQFVSQNQIDINGCIKRPSDITHKKIWGFDYFTAIVTNLIYWPFDPNKKVTFIELSAFLGSLKIFKYLILNHADINDELIDFAIAGGNFEIIHTCEQKGCEISLKSIQNSIQYYHTDIFVWLVDNNPKLIEENLNAIASSIITYSNPQAFLVLFQNSFNLNNIIIDTFYYIEHEWLNFFIKYDLIHKYLDLTNPKCIQALFNHKNFKNFKFLLSQLKEKIDLNIDQISKLIDLNEHFKYNSFHSLQYYFEAKGEIEQYQNELILPPFPNKIIIKYLKLRKNNYHFFISHNNYEIFLVFLIKRKALSFDKELNLQNIIRFAIYSNYVELLEDIQKVEPSVSKIIYPQIFYKNWYYFIFSDDKLKSFFFKNSLQDVESNLSFQTEGLHYACFIGDYCTADSLLKRKYIDVNSKKFDNGRTPLNLASECNFVNIVYLLINDERIDLNSFSNDHETSLYSACEYNYIEIVELFLKCKKIDINIKNKEGKTPFFIACERGNVKIVKRMLTRCDLIVNIMSKNISAFGIAVENWNLNVVKALINDNRIKFQLENEMNPLQRACSRGNLEMVKVLFSIDSINKNELDDVFKFNFFNRKVLIKIYLFIEISYILLVLMEEMILQII